MRVLNLMLLSALLAFPATADTSALEYVAAGPAIVAPGGRIDFTLRVTNTGSNTWSPVSSAECHSLVDLDTFYSDCLNPFYVQGSYYVYLVAFDMDSPDPMSQLWYRNALIALPGPIGPGETVEVTTHVIAPSEPSRYILVPWTGQGSYNFTSHILNSPQDGFDNAPHFEFVVSGDTPPAGTPWRITEWTEATPVPETTYYTAAVAHGNHIFFLHFTGRVFSGEVRPDGSIAGWTETLAMPHAEENIKSAVVVGDRLVVPGKPTSMIGSIGSGGAIESWSEGPAVNSPSTGGRVAVAHGSWIFTMGGSYPYWQMVDLVEAAFLSPDGTLSAWQQVSTLPVGAGLQDPIPTVIGDDLVVFGGETGNGDTTYSSNIFRAPIRGDGTLGTWAFVGRTLMPRPHSAYLRYGETIHAVGGGVHAYMTDHVESSLLTEFGLPDRAVVSAPLPTVRNAPNTVTVGRFGYVLGGNTCPYGGCYPTSVWMARLASDSTPPVLSLPGSLTVEATGPSGAQVLFVAMALDDTDGEVVVACTASSGSAFPLGSTAVSCSATDAAGNVASGAFAVTVVDSTPPVLTLPALSEIEASSPGGALVTFSATAADTVDGAVATTCVPSSGSLFPVGSTTVTCSAVDAHGNAATGSFPITVRPFGPPPVTVVLVDSTGAGLAGAVVSYYQGSWQPFGVTGADGRARLALPAGNYSFRVELGGGSVQKSQDTGTSPVVSFQTVNVAVRLRDSAGSPLDTGTADYYAGSWRAFGTTNGGEARREMLPTTYSFAMTYLGGRVQVNQNVALNAVVTFQTRLVTTRLRNSQGAPLDTGAAEYYAGIWRAFGTTQGGEVSRELLPISYSFAMTYEGGRIQATQDVSANPVVTFQTREVVVGLRSSANLPLDGGIVEYYAGSWRPFGTTAAGEARKELLPTSYSFAVRWAGGRFQLMQNVATSPSVVFQTGAVLSDSGTCTSYYATSWKPFAQGIELLPGTYPFTFSSGTPSQQSFTIAAGVANHIR